MYVCTYVWNPRGCPRPRTCPRPKKTIAKSWQNYHFHSSVCTYVVISTQESWGRLGEAWGRPGSELGRNWVGTGLELGRNLGRNSGSELSRNSGWELGGNCVPTESELGRSSGSELGRNWINNLCFQVSQAVSICAPHTMKVKLRQLLQVRSMYVCMPVCMYVHTDTAYVRSKTTRASVNNSNCVVRQRH